MFRPESASEGPASAAGGWRLEHRYAELPALFHVAETPTPVRAPRLVVLNRPLAESLGLDAAALDGEAGAAIFAGNALPPGARPIAQAYAGHQYGHFTKLGDGRAILLGEQITPRGERFDIQLKGAGPTAFSRRGDGRAALGPMLREYLVSEAMAALGIPTTRSLAVATTGEKVLRQSELPGAVLTRVAASHIRVGTFEWAAVRGEPGALQALVDHALERHYPELADAGNRAQALLDGAIERQAALIARWMLVGFVHGVMNTDNMAISGETIDYGPCAFMDAYDPATVFSSIDANGRYAYGNQPAIAQWNLARFGETLLPLLDGNEERAIARATESLERFAQRFEQHWLDGMRRKLGLFDAEPDDRALVRDLLGWMHEAKADYTNTFAALATSIDGSDGAALPGTPVWRERWQARLQRQPQTATEAHALRQSSSPAFVPRNHLVEAALGEAERGDLRPLETLHEIVTKPYDHARAAPDYREPAPDGGVGYRTFCGT